MVPPIRSVTFWLGGVIAPCLWQLTRSALEINGVEASLDLCSYLIELEQKIGAGSLSSDEYCRGVLEQAGLHIPPEKLASAIENQIEPTSGLLEILAALRQSYPLYLLSDYPLRWLLPALERLSLAQYFPEQSIMMLSAYGLVELSSDLFSKLSSPRSLVPEDGLLVDGDAQRAMGALRTGILSTVFVDASRLKREFVLLGMLPS